LTTTIYVSIRKSQNLPFVIEIEMIRVNVLSLRSRLRTELHSLCRAKGVRLGGQELPTFPRWSANATAFDSRSQSRATPASCQDLTTYPRHPPHSHLHPYHCRLGQRTIHTASNMSSEQVIEQLRSHINSLETRVHELEGKYGKPDTGSKSTVDGMRMILIGPPGAGTYIFAIAQ
jgi:hypothetical protein